VGRILVRLSLVLAIHAFLYLAINIFGLMGIGWYCCDDDDVRGAFGDIWWGWCEVVLNQSKIWTDPDAWFNGEG